MATTSLCDKAKAILNINQGCNIGRSLDALSSSLPVHVDALSDAAASVDDALNKGPQALRDLNNTIMEGASGVQNTIHTANALANLPANVVNAEIRNATQEINNVAMATVGVLNALNCVAETLTNKSIPGIHRAAACVASGANSLNKALEKVQKTVNGWQKTVNDSIGKFMGDIDSKVNSTLKEFEKDHAAAQCLSSMVYIPDDVFKDTTSLLDSHQTDLSALAKQASGCAGGAKSTSKSLRQASAGLSQAATARLAANQKMAEQVARIQAATVDPLVRKIVDAVPADILPGMDDEIATVQDAVDSAADDMDNAADKTDLVSVNFTYGHDIVMDRVGNFIRIFHKDGHYTLYNATNIIHAADVTNKHLLWLENAITKFNSHTHLYNPGPGAPTPTVTPLPIFDMTDGTTVTKAG